MGNVEKGPVMGDALSGFQRLPGRPPRPVAQGLLAVIATVLILACGLFAGRVFTDETPAPAPAPAPSRSTA